MDQKSDLLSLLAELTGVEYLSDLHDSRKKQDILQALNSIIPEDYPAALWADAAGYILKEAPPHFDTSADAYHFLHHRLGGSPS